MTDIHALLARVSELDGTLIKNAAAAIYEVRDDPYDLEKWGDLDGAERERYECDARAALEAVTPSTQTLARALQAVLEVHAQDSSGTCNGCSKYGSEEEPALILVDWPCLTVRAITESIGDTHD